MNDEELRKLERLDPRRAKVWRWRMGRTRPEDFRGRFGPLRVLVDSVDARLRPHRWPEYNFNWRPPMRPRLYATTADAESELFATVPSYRTTTMREWFPPPRRWTTVPPGFRLNFEALGR